MRIPETQRAQVDAPLHVIAAAAARLHLPRGHPLALELPPPPSGYMRVALWPAQLQRAAIGFAAAASHGLATAPASVDVSARTTWHWRTRVLRRVMGGYVDRIQVRWSCRLIDTLRKQLNTPANRFLNAKAGAHVQGHQTNKAGARSCWRRHVYCGGTATVIEARWRSGKAASAL